MYKTERVMKPFHVKRGFQVSRKGVRSTNQYTTLFLKLQKANQKK